MLIVRGTKQLRDRLRSAPLARDGDQSTTLLGDWFATALFWKPQVVLLVNSRTMLPVLMPLAPAATLLERAPETIGRVLGEHGVPDDVVASELTAMTDVRLAPTNNRQLVGVMNEVVFQADSFRERSSVELTDVELTTLSMALSNVILGPLMKRHGTSADELRSLLGDDATVIPYPNIDTTKLTTTGAAPGRVHQLKVTLRGTKPPIWRRVLVNGGETLNHLHDVIQAAFGWYDSHLHEFEIGNERYGIPHEDDWAPVHDERRVSIDQVIDAGRMRYTYDFGDNWEHDVLVEKTVPAEGATALPACIDGRRACPPEDCGGPWGYEDLLQILADPAHLEHRERLEWIGHPYDPDAFDPEDFAENLRLQQTTRFDDWLT